MWEKRPTTSGGGGGGNEVTSSGINGNIKVDGEEITVYDDTSIRNLIGGETAYLSGKKINCLGDSLTQGAIFGTPWTTMIQNDFGCTVRNYGVVGSTFIDNSTQWSMSYRWPNMDNDADIVVVWGGYNDINTGLPLGVFADRVATTYYGAIHLMLNGLQTKYLGKKIFICTILDTFHAWNTVKLWNQAIREVAEYYAIPVIDLSQNLGFNARNTDNRATLFGSVGTPDATHPNTAGNRIIADYIAKYISSH